MSALLRLLCSLPNALSRMRASSVVASIAHSSVLLPSACNEEENTAGVWWT